MADGLRFRPLEADEIEVRVAQAKYNGVSLLLYKDARCDMRMLDDAVGAENWECSYDEVHNALYCTVRIFDKDRGEWVSKQDCGVPSNMEGTKGESSDAFKRACFRWGIGRELYTAPFIWVNNQGCTIKQNGKDNKGRDRYVCYDRFSVKSIKTEDGRIRSLTVKNDSTGKVVWSNENNGSQSGKTASNDVSCDDATNETTLESVMEKINARIEEFGALQSKSRAEVIDALMKSKTMDGAGAFNSLTKEQANNALCLLIQWIGKAKAKKEAEEYYDEDIPF